MFQFSTVAKLAVLVFCLANVSSAQEAGQQGLPKSPEPNIIGAGGEFTTSVEIRLPEYRNAPLPVSLSYNSSNTSRGGADNVVGFGWSLRANSVIERRSYGGGVPSFDGANDMYLLDGMELMACKGSGATTPWDLPYPTALHTSNPSASCAAGGNMAPRIENFQRVVFKPAQNIFEVTRKDGTRLIYRSVGELAGETNASGTDEWKVARKSRWLLSEIIDTQSSPNTVTYRYAFSPAGKGFAPRLAEISYGPYRIQFRYDRYSDAGMVAPKFATGTDILGEQDYRLRSVLIYSGTTGIRAYQIAHEKSALSKAALVTSVREYGGDFTVTSGVADITGGASLPPLKFDYSRDSFSYSSKAYNAQGFPLGNRVFDFDRDGADEIASANLHLGFQGRVMSELSILKDPCVSPLPVSSSIMGELHDLWAIKFQKKIITDGDRSGGDAYCINDHLAYLGESSSGNYRYYYSLFSRNTRTGSVIDQHVLDSSRTSFGVKVQEVDGDASPEFFDLSSGIGSHTPTPVGVSVGETVQVSEDGTFLPLGINDNLPRYPGALVTDINGDGIDDSFSVGRVGAISRKALSTWSTFEVNDSEIHPDIIRSGQWSPFPLPSTSFLGYADFNADGVTDTVYYNPRMDNADSVIVQRITGAGLAGWAEYSLPVDFESFPLPRLGEGIAIKGNSSVSDINSDGLPDIVYDKGTTIPGGGCLGAMVFMNNGTGFNLVNFAGGIQTVNCIVATGDFDGDGLADIAKRDGSILYGQISASEKGLPNRMIGVTYPEGGALEINYAPSSEFGVNQMPGIQQMVSAIKRLDGRGGASVSRYSYNRGGYDFDERKTLGYRTVTETLPKIAGETDSPTIVTTYANDHFASKDQVISKIMLDGAGEVLKREINQYERVLTGNGPYRIDLIQTRTAEIYDTALVERSIKFDQNQFGEITLKTDVGFTSAGNDLHPNDNIVEAKYFRPNLDRYIVDKPRVIVTRFEQAPSSGPQNLMRKEYYYDGDIATDGEQSAPVRGNLTLVRGWSGPASAPVLRTETTRQYGASGQVTQEANARGAITRFEYDASNQFIIKTTSPLGHEVTTTWDRGCQKPLKTVDANAQSTVFDYDGFCREISKVGADGAYVSTFYRAYGNPETQHIEMQSPSGNVGLKVIKKVYFDGLGRIYREVSPDSSGVAANAIAQTSAYDGRGNLSWKSIPLPLSDTSVQPSERTSMTYDGLNRPLSVINPDGTVRQTKYKINTFAHFGAPSMSYPVVATFDEDYSETAQGSGEYWEVSDAQGRRVRQVWWDRANTDSDAGTTPHRVVHYRYGGLGELLQISTDGNISWAYEYDAAGNRIEAVDPGLGTWTLLYDANGNLTKQTDAKGQVIEFTYNLEDMVTQKRVSGGLDGTQTTTTIYGAPDAANRAAQRIVSMSRGVHKISYTYLPGGQIGTETHVIADTAAPRSFVITRTYLEGVLKNQTLPYKPGDDDAADAGTFAYDAAGRLKSMSRGTTSFISSINYNRWGQPTETIYGSGARDVVDYDADRGWPTRYRSFAPTATSPFNQVSYTRTAAGRVDRQDTDDPKSDFDYSYDYAGRLVAATNLSNQLSYTQTFDYDRVGRMVANSRLGAYNYGSSFPRHAPKSLTLANGTIQTFTYDANGNMTRGLDGKLMTYDGENRPLSVTHTGTVTSYVYGADGTRLKRIEKAANGTSVVTAYFGPVEIRQYGQGAAEQVFTYPHPNVRLGNGQPSHLHTDQLGSVRAGSGSDGARNYRKVYRPFGEEEEWRDDLTAPVEDKGFVGERYDAGAGLHYLNARYYDPKLALFIQPDWFEVAKPGVGTNRFAYSFNDPVNKRDPEGNYTEDTEDAHTREHEQADDEAKYTKLAQNRGGRGGRGSPNQEVITSLTYDAYRRIDHLRAELGLPPQARLLGPRGTETNAQLNLARTELRGLQMQANAQAGRRAEALFETYYSGNILGRQITIETSTGVRTRVDAILGLNGRVGAEIKNSTTARMSPGQRQLMRDIVNGQPVTPRGANAAAAGFTPGQRITLDGYMMCVPTTW